MSVSLGFPKRRYYRVALALIITTILLVNLPIATLQSKSYHSTNGDTTDETYDLLIIAPKQFSRYLSPLVEHKTAHQIKTRQITTEEIYQKKLNIL